MEKKRGRPYGTTKKESRVVQKFCKFSLEESETVNKAAMLEDIAISRFITEAAIEKAKKINKGR